MLTNVFTPRTDRHAELRALWLEALRATKSQIGDGRVDGKAVDFFIEQLGAVVEFDSAAKKRIRTQAEGIAQMLRQGKSPTTKENT